MSSLVMSLESDEDNDPVVSESEEEGEQPVSRKKKKKGKAPEPLKDEFRWEDPQSGSSSSAIDRIPAGARAKAESLNAKIQDAIQRRSRRGEDEEDEDEEEEEEEEEESSEEDEEEDEEDDDEDEKRFNYDKDGKRGGKDDDDDDDGDDGDGNDGNNGDDGDDDDGDDGDDGDDDDDDDEGSEEPTKTESKKKKAKTEKSKKKNAKNVEDEDDDDEIIDERTIKTTAAPTVTNVGSFDNLKLSRPLVRAVRELGWNAPTPIQQSTIPVALAGHDILANAVTGSGKTAAFLLPVLERLQYRAKRVTMTRVLILTPTRELAAQIHEQGSKLAKYTDIRLCMIVGGLSLQTQEVELRSRPDIIVATPGRMIDHLRNTQSVHMEDLEILILDEADRLLEMGFADEVGELVNMCPRGRQTLLFSATLTENVVDLVHLSLNNPKRISVDAYNGMVAKLSQEFIRVRKQGEGNREALVLALCKRSFQSRTIVFIKSKQLAHRMRLIFGLAKLKAAELHGNLTQAQRMAALDQFKRGEVDFLLATDLASRGLDIRGVETVINMSMPRIFSTYLHRVGRTARAGKSGCSVTLMGEGNKKLLKEVLKHVPKVKSRHVDPAVVKKYKTSIRTMQEDISHILNQEKVDKQIRVSEMEVNRANNLMEYQDDIYSRPARSWFQTEAEKQHAKEKAVAVCEVKETTTEREAKKKSKAEKRAEKKAEKDQDPLRGLSRKKRRRKMMMMEDEEMRKEMEAEAREQGKNQQPMMLSESAVRAHAKSAKQRARDAKLADVMEGPAMDLTQKPKKGDKKRAKSELKNEHRFTDKRRKRVDSRYAYKPDKDLAKQAEAAANDQMTKERKKRSSKPGIHSFKSKKRFKRRK